MSAHPYSLSAGARLNGLEKPSAGYLPRPLKTPAIMAAANPNFSKNQLDHPFSHHWVRPNPTPRRTLPTAEFRARTLGQKAKRNDRAPVIRPGSSNRR